MGTIRLKNIRTFSYHGCLPEESKIGSEYSTNLKIKADLRKSAKSDKLSDTVDYVMLHQIVAAEMAVPSNLLEHVAQRIMDQIFRQTAEVSYVSVRVSKINPPIGGDVEEVSVQIDGFRA